MSIATIEDPKLGAVPWPVGTSAPIQVAPGKFARLPTVSPSTVSPPTDLPRLILCEVIPLGGGTFRLQPRPLTDWVGFNQRVLDGLGISASQTTLRRLGVAGFIEVRQISPNRYEFSVSSWVTHCQRVQADPEFWARADGKGKTNLRKYLEVTCDV